MVRLTGITLWLLGGAALSAAAYWGFLITPESNVFALLLSAVLSLLTLVLVGITVNGASLAWSLGWSGPIVRRSIARIPAFIAAAIVAVAIWWIVGRGMNWVSAHSGEISAWFIARFGWADASPFFNTVLWGGRWLQWVAGPLFALSLLGSMLIGEWSASRWRWLARGFSPFRLTLATLWFGVFVLVPWLYLVPWRPQGLPATSIEVAFVGTKLVVAALLMAVGVALVVRQGSAPTPEH